MAQIVPQNAATMSVNIRLMPCRANCWQTRRLQQARHRGHRHVCQRAAEQVRKPCCPDNAGQNFQLRCAARQCAGRVQPCFGLDDAQPAGGQLTGKLVHGLDAAQMDRHGGYVPYQRDGIPPRQVRRRKDAVGQNIDVEVPHAEAGGHDLHGLLRAEHLAAVF
mgnify:CR=1 FL=1